MYNRQPVLKGKIVTKLRFTAVRWSKRGSDPGGKFPFGIIAAGLSDGSIEIYDAAVLVNGGGGAVSLEAARLAQVRQHKGLVHALDFNPHKSMSQIMASGGADGAFFFFFCFLHSFVLIG